MSMDWIGSITKAKVRPELIQSALAPAEAVAQGGRRRLRSQNPRRDDEFRHGGALARTLAPAPAGALGRTARARRRGRDGGFLLRLPARPARPSQRFRLPPAGGERCPRPQRSPDRRVLAGTP